MRNLEAFEFEVFGGCMIRAAEPQVAALLSLPTPRPGRGGSALMSHEGDCVTCAIHPCAYTWPERDMIMVIVMLRDGSGRWMNPSHPR